MTNSLKPAQLAGIVLGSCVAVYLVYTHLQNFSDVSFLGMLVMLEVGIVAIWNFERRFFVVLQLTFVWAGLHIPMSSAGVTGRWAALGAGAVIGFILWIQAPRKPFHVIHMFAFFCVCMAAVSATVSSYVQIASLKALSLGLLFLYCVSGARLAVIGREQRFFNGLILACEITVFGTAFYYFVLHDPIWGNPNALGAVMSIAVFPILLWGWMIADGSHARNHRLLALLVCTYLIRFSLSRAALITEVSVAVIFCILLRRYKLLLKMTAIVLFVVSLGSLLSPDSVSQQLSDFKDAMLYKGHKEEGLMGSRNKPWDDSVKSIKAHPWFGTGYGTSPTGDDPGVYLGSFHSTGEVEREHGSSYVTITEWVGLVGVLPFIGLLLLTLSKMWKVFVLMKRTANVRYYSVPLAFIVFGGLIHAGFEDWLFAVGSYLCVYFWVCAFVLADLAPEGDLITTLTPTPSSRSYRPSPANYGTVVSNP